MLKQKWKLFAFEYFFNTEGLTVPGIVKLFDELTAVHSENQHEELLQKVSNRAKIWPLETVGSAVADMRELAIHAQDVENMEG